MNNHSPNRFFFLKLLFLFFSMTVTAIPVRRGQFKTIRLIDGNMVRVEARGDERAHYWQSADGTCYVPDGLTGLYRETDAATLGAKALANRGAIVRPRAQRIPDRRRQAGSGNLFKGMKRGLIILVEFSGKTFSMPNPQRVYDQIANDEGYRENGFKGSVRDYFLAQSHGMFNLSFDVVGPVSMPHPYSYYGRNNDANVGEMIRDACVAVDAKVDFSQYDWDGDGEAEEVFVLYAGYGQSDHSEIDDYIWPHMSALSGSPNHSVRNLKLDNTVIDIYACSNELANNDKLNGIGTFCHEFSHCMGFPDMYDTSGGGNFGMGSWDLMDYGSYNDDGFTPCGYSGYEKMICGWATPVELATETKVSGMRSLADHGQSYIYYNSSNRNEYYILDNRQQRGYDIALPGHGLLITHVDYDKKAWNNNIVNTICWSDDPNKNNPRQRLTISPADNIPSIYDEGDDAYPYHDNNRLCKDSSPASKFYNADPQHGEKPLFGFFDITEHADGTISFHFREDDASPETPPDDFNHNESVLFYESFDKCVGSGGNDGKFKKSVAIGELQPDNAGWAADYGCGGDRCARFGKTNKGTGVAVTPTFVLPGDTVTLTFKAACWDTKGDGNNLFLTLRGDKAKFVDTDASSSQLTMAKGAWTTYTLRMVGKGSATIIFSPDRRFFLDEVKITRPGEQALAGIKGTGGHLPKSKRIYSVDGRYVGSDYLILPRGVYIVNGKKVVKEK